MKTFSSGRDSPSTREAIAGMLSISEQGYSTTSEKTLKASKLAKPVRDQEEDEDLLLENIDKVHQDEYFSKFLVTNYFLLFYLKNNFFVFVKCFKYMTFVFSLSSIRCIRRGRIYFQIEI